MAEKLNRRAELHPMLAFKIAPPRIRAEREHHSKSMIRLAGREPARLDPNVDCNQKLVRTMYFLDPRRLRGPIGCLIRVSACIAIEGDENATVSTT